MFVLLAISIHHNTTDEKRRNINYMLVKRIYFLILLSLFGFVKMNFAQWQATNFPETIQVNAIATNDSLVFAGTKGYGMFVSKDNGMNWNEINNGLQNKVINTILIDGSSIFVGNELGVSISTNNGNNWSSINNGLANMGVWSLAINKSTSSSTLFAGTWNGVYSSTNNGSNWKVTGLANTMVPVNSVITMNNSVYAATNGDGFFQSNDNGVTWINISFIAGVYSVNQFTQAISTIMDEKVGVKPTYALAKINSNVVVSVGNAFICYKSISARSFANQTNANIVSDPIISFTARGNILYAVDASGEMISSENDGMTWKLFLPDLRYNVMSSLANNSLYIFAGMARGIKRLYLPFTNQEITQNIEIPTQSHLYQNYPNPFNPSTEITYELSAFGQVSLKVYDLLGKEVATLVDEEKEPGIYKVEFNVSHSGRNREMTSGIYLYTLVANGIRMTKKFILLK
jgi:photosystem II stability/assembly factor-like uncharacterized protein